MADDGWTEEEWRSLPCYRKDPTATTLTQLRKQVPLRVFISRLPRELCQRLFGFPAVYTVFNDRPYHLNLDPDFAAKTPSWQDRAQEMASLGFTYLCSLAEFQMYEQRLPFERVEPIGWFYSMVFVHEKGEAYASMDVPPRSYHRFRTTFADQHVFGTVRTASTQTDGPQDDIARLPPEWTVQAVWLKHQEEVERRASQRGGVFRELGLEHWCEQYRKRRRELTEQAVQEGHYVPAKLP